MPAAPPLPLLLALVWERLCRLPSLYLALWALLAVSTVVLVLLMRSEWGRARPTHRYVMLSLVAHLVLICLATTIRFVSSPAGDGPAPVKVRIVMRSPPAPEPVEQEPVPTAPAGEQSPTEPAPASPPDDAPAIAQTPAPRESPAQETLPAPSPGDDAAVETPDGPDATQPAPEDAAQSQVAATPEPRTVPPKQPTPTADAPPHDEPSPEPRHDAATPVDAPPRAVRAPHAPTAFAARDGQQRLERLLEDGGDSATEDAVAAALAWLASAQSPDGRWDADRWAAGRERGAILGHDRQSVGARADTAMTGLALLTLMGAGHSHDDGPFADTIEKGLAYLVRSQHADGNLYGQSQFYAQTYCHSMATFSLAEAKAVTGDKRLEAPVRRAVAFIASQQHPTAGGWRYRFGDPGDMSQLGWVIMAVRSAELAGVESPPKLWDGIERFVASTQSGRYGGLASYRPNSSPSRSMTAEAFYCRQILGRPIDREAANEAVNEIVLELPGQGRTNLYAWYYSTLALHHHRRSSRGAENAWQIWNESLKRALVSTQVTDGVNQGSWSPNTVWGRCGGRVYTTALAAMCLEVYYRYDPTQLARDPWIAAREAPSNLR